MIQLLNFSLDSFSASPLHIDHLYCIAVQFRKCSSELCHVLFDFGIFNHCLNFTFLFNYFHTVKLVQSFVNQNCKIAKRYLISVASTFLSFSCVSMTKRWIQLSANLKKNLSSDYGSVVKCGAFIEFLCYSRCHDTHVGQSCIILTHTTV